MQHRTGHREDIRIKFVKRGFVESESLSLQDRIQQVEAQQQEENDPRAYMMLEGQLKQLRWELRALEQLEQGSMEPPHMVAGRSSSGDGRGPSMEYVFDGTARSSHEVDPDRRPVGNNV